MFRGACGNSCRAVSVSKIRANLCFLAPFSKLMKQSRWIDVVTRDCLVLRYTQLHSLQRHLATFSLLYSDNLCNTLFQLEEHNSSRVKKLLRRVKGVYAITIDPVKGLILISGTAEPSLLIKAIERTGQTPQIYGYEKDPAKAKTQFRALLKRYRPEDEPPPTQTTTAGTCPVRGDSFRGFGYSGPPTMMQMPIFTLPPTMGPPGWLAPGPRPRFMVRYEQPKVMTRKSPAPYPFDFYETKDSLASDSLFHYFSDHQPQPCTIM